MTGEVAALLRGVDTVLLDFDGPVCALFAGCPAASIEEELAVIAAAAGAVVPPEYRIRHDPLDILRYAATVSLGLVALIERNLADAEIRAADSAEPTLGAATFLSACRMAGWTVAIVSNNAPAAINNYLRRTELVRYVRLVLGHHPTDPRLMKPNPTSDPR